MQQALRCCPQARPQAARHRLACGTFRPLAPAFNVGLQLHNDASHAARRRGPVVARQAEAGGSSGGSGGSVGLFPAGKRQARVQLPALMLTVTPEDVLGLGQQGRSLEDVGAAVAAGATAVVLTAGSGGGGGGGQLYEAAVRLKELLRGRAALLVADRTDIVDAAGADGALLTAAGLPTVVAKRMLQDGLALVGRSMAAAEAAAEAAADGANFVVLEPSNSGAAAPNAAEAVAAQQQQRSSASIPVVAAVGGAASRDQLAGLLAAGVDGLALPLAALRAVAAALAAEPPASAGDAASAILQWLAGGGAEAAPAGAGPGAEAAAGRTAAPERAAAQLTQLLSSSREELVDAERQLLSEVLAFLGRWCPSLEEAGLLRDALRQLDELFLLVVLGEFNSGKSAVVNALLGQRYLAEGILPTTNEINVLKHADPAQVEGGAAQDGDGVFTRYLPADLLREVNVVDTPGTNVILGRQQRLTEEYVPRADLVLFVLSADRPLTESEVRFLRYVRQWGKKVVFVVNKTDILSSPAEVEEVVGFVRSNAARVLQVDEPRVLAVSARAAMEAKLEVMGGADASSSGRLSPEQAAALAAHPSWRRSGFEALESFVFEFLTGGGRPSAGGSSSGAAGGEGGRAGAESVRLKLESPLFVADALLDAAAQQLAAELAVARQDEASVRLVRSQLAAFRREMEKEGQLQRDEVARQVAGSARKAAAIVDQLLQLSNVEVITSYLFGGDSKKALPVAAKFDEGFGGATTAALRGLVQEHSSWLSANCQRQVANYRSFAEARAASLGETLDGLLNSELEGLGSDAEARRRWREMRQLAAEAAPSGGGGAGGAEAAVVAVARLDPKTTAVMLEEEVREAVVGTAGTAAGAGALGVLLTSVLPTTVEDLLALALAAAVGYASILNLPMRRAEAKRKLEATTGAFAEDIQAAMQAELRQALDVCEAEVLSFIAPLEQMTAAEVRRLEQAEEGRAALVGSLDGLKQRVANVE